LLQSLLQQVDARFADGMVPEPPSPLRQRDRARFGVDMACSKAGDFLGGHSFQQQADDRRVLRIRCIFLNLVT
jgi:hypothetical protein